MTLDRSRGHLPRPAFTREELNSPGLELTPQSGRGTNPSSALAGGYAGDCRRWESQVWVLEETKADRAQIWPDSVCHRICLLPALGEQILPIHTSAREAELSTQAVTCSAAPAARQSLLLIRTHYCSPDKHHEAKGCCRSLAFAGLMGCFNHWRYCFAPCVSNITCMELSKTAEWFVWVLLPLVAQCRLRKGTPETPMTPEIHWIAVYNVIHRCEIAQRLLLR